MVELSAIHPHQISRLLQMERGSEKCISSYRKKPLLIGEKRRTTEGTSGVINSTCVYFELLFVEKILNY